jgi:hypothetical protein
MAHAQKPDFALSAKRTSPFKSAGTSVQSTTGSRGVRISVSNARYTKFRGGVKGTGYPLHSPVSPSLLLPYLNVCHHVPTGIYIPVTITSQQTCISGYNFETVALFGPFTWRYSELSCKLTYSNVGGRLCAFVNTVKPA